VALISVAADARAAEARTAINPIEYPSVFPKVITDPQKKADLVKNPEGLNQVGLLNDRPAEYARPALHPVIRFYCTDGGL
jgi:hypothetical protein